MPDGNVGLCRWAKVAPYIDAIKRYKYASTHVVQYHYKKRFRRALKYSARLINF